MKFLIYGAAHCGFCAKAVYLLQDRGVEYEYLKVRNDDGSVTPHRDELIGMLKHMDRVLIPQIFEDHGGELIHIGGYDDLVKYFQEFDRDG